MKRAVTKTAGQSVNGVMEFVDVDGIVRRIDVNDVVQRIDWDAVLDKVEIDRVLERTDLNRHLDRVDINKLLSRVDVNALLLRSDLGPLITASGTGVFTHLLDQIRIQIALIDQALHTMTQGRGWRKRKWYNELPPAPGIAETPTPPPFPDGTSNKAVALQGRVAGGLSQLLAWCLDNFLAALIFSFLLRVGDFVWQEMVTRRLRRQDETFRLSENLEEEISWLYAFLFWLWFVSYHFAFIALTGRTIGQAVFGLLVGDSAGRSVKPLQAAVRAPLVLVSIASVVGALIGLFRKDRRALHDLVAGTATVYAWDAKAAGLRDAELMSMERIHPVFEEESIVVAPETEATLPEKND